MGQMARSLDLAILGFLDDVIVSGLLTSGLPDQRPNVVVMHRRSVVSQWYAAILNIYSSHNRHET